MYSAWITQTEQKHPCQCHRGLFGQCSYLDSGNYLPYLSLEMFACTLHSWRPLPRSCWPHVGVCACMCACTRLWYLMLPGLSAGLWQHREQRSQGQCVLSGGYLLCDWWGAQTPPGTAYGKQGTDRRQQVFPFACPHNESTWTDAAPYHLPMLLFLSWLSNYKAQGHICPSRVSLSYVMVKVWGSGSPDCNPPTSTTPLY